MSRSSGFADVESRIVHIHATEYDRAGGHYGNPLIRDIEYVGLHMADHVFAVSSFTKDVLIREYGIPAEKISVAENVMNVSVDLINESESTYKYLQMMRSRGYGIVLA